MKRKVNLEGSPTMRARMSFVIEAEAAGLTSIRALHALVRAGCESMDDVAEFWGRYGSAQLTNFGRVSEYEVTRAVKRWKRINRVNTSEAEAVR